MDRRTRRAASRTRPGELVASKSAPVTTMVIVLSGHVAIHVATAAGAAPRKIMEWRGGDVTGTLPYSRMHESARRQRGDGGDRVYPHPLASFPRADRALSHVTAILVHIMVDRARHFTSTDWQDEKTMSLGRLAAGLAHELNNPASAVIALSEAAGRGAGQIEEAAQALGAARITEDERASIRAMRDETLIPATTGVFSAIERSDREDEISTWLEEHDADTSPANALAETGITLDSLDALADAVAPSTLDLALRCMAARYTTRVARLGHRARVVAHLRPRLGGQAVHVHGSRDRQRAGERRPGRHGHGRGVGVEGARKVGQRPLGDSGESAARSARSAAS